MKVLKMVEQKNTWNDDRLDELSGRVDAGFARVDAQFEKVDARFEKVEGEMKEGFAKVDKRFDKVEGEMKVGFAELRVANERLYRLLFLSAISIVGVLITALAAALAT